VLLTVRGDRRPKTLPGIEVPVLTRDESIALLNELVPGVPVADRRGIAAECDDLPRALVEATGLLAARRRGRGPLFERDLPGRR
jgi:hypothetical protein